MLQRIATSLDRDTAQMWTITAEASRTAIQQHTLWIGLGMPVCYHADRTEVVQLQHVGHVLLCCQCGGFHLALKPSSKCVATTITFETSMDQRCHIRGRLICFFTLPQSTTQDLIAAVMAMACTCLQTHMHARTHEKSPGACQRSYHCLQYTMTASGVLISAALSQHWQI